jgi:hypothetical protein
MNVRFPAFPNTPFGQLVQVAFQSVTAAFAGAVSKDEATDRIILRAPNGSTYAVTTDNSGVLTTAALSGKTREI